MSTRQKGLILPVLFAVVLFFSTSLYAGDTTGPYIGIGGSFAYENFGTDELDKKLEPYGLKVDFDNSLGVNAKVGYHFNRWLAFEFNFDYLPNFEWDGSTTYLGIPIKVSADVDITTYMLAGKLSPDIGSATVRPFIAGGFGWMHGEVEARASAMGTSASTSDSETAPCAKIGLGIALFASKNVSVEIEGSYVWSFGNDEIRDINYEIRYMNLTLGVAYHFHCCPLLRGARGI